MMQPEFTYSWYEKLINYIYTNGYTITNYHEYKNVKKPCIMRHDIDMNLNKAADFAEREAEFWKENGLKGATYFLLLSSDFYNVFSKESLRQVDKILSFGNEIGLHFDELRYPLKDNSLLIQDYIEEELYLLERILGIKINTVSMHRPSKLTLESNYILKNAVNSYSNEFFQNFKYISDSRMNWRENAFEVISSNEYDKLHILTHPFWYDDLNNSTRAKLLEFIDKASIDRYRWISDNFRNLEEFVQLEEII